MNIKLDLPALLKRPEVLTLLVTIVVMVLVSLGVATCDQVQSTTPPYGPVCILRNGAEIPQGAIGQVLTVFLAIFVGAVFEGKFKGVDYAGGLKQLVGSAKFRLGLVVLLGMVVNALLKPLGQVIPDDTWLAFGNLVFYVILAIAGIDGLKASRAVG